jgi:hypothetical protein
MAEDHTNEPRDVALRKIGRQFGQLPAFRANAKARHCAKRCSRVRIKLAKVHRDRTKNTDRKPLGWLVEELKTIYSNASCFVAAFSRIVFGNRFQIIV